VHLPPVPSIRLPPLCYNCLLMFLMERCSGLNLDFKKQGRWCRTSPIYTLGKADQRARETSQRDMITL